MLRHFFSAVLAVICLTSLVLAEQAPVKGPARLCANEGVVGRRRVGLSARGVGELAFTGIAGVSLRYNLAPVSVSASSRPRLGLRMSSSLSSSDEAGKEETDMMVPNSPANLVGFSTGTNLVTYGDLFRQVEVDEVEDKEVVAEYDRICEQVITASYGRPAGEEGEKEEQEVGGKRRSVMSSAISGVTNVLNSIFAGPDSDEVSKNLEAFARSHPGAVGLAIKSKPTKRLVDIDCLERCFDSVVDDFE